jgi:glycosyltransferase 2 family protein
MLPIHAAVTSIVGGGLALTAVAVAFGAGSLQRHARFAPAWSCSGDRRATSYRWRRGRRASPAQLLAWALQFAGLVLLLDTFDVGAPLAVAPVVVSLQLLAASVPLTPGGAGTQQALIAPLSAGTI